jgi:hypothetical protein
MYPWEAKPKFDYIAFMDTHIRVSVFINGHPQGSFSILDEGMDLNVESNLPDGTPLVFKVTGHPRTKEPRMSITELVHHILEAYNTTLR